MLTRESISKMTQHRVDQDVGRGDKGNYYAKVMRFEEAPRLKLAVTIYARHDLPDDEQWFADGERMPDLETALRWLNDNPLPALTIVERVVLEQIDDKLMGEPGSPEHIRALVDKGCIEREQLGGPRIRRTELGRQVLANGN